MPGRKFHNEINRRLFGATYDRLNAIKDGPSKQYGKGHRRYLHSPADNLILALLLRDPNAFAAATVHDAVDKAVSKLPEPLRRMFYE